MPTKVGTISNLGRRGSAFTEVYLDTGERVEVPHGVLQGIAEVFPAALLVFVERRGRAFHFVQWVGTPLMAVAALREGRLEPFEVPEEVKVLAKQEAAEGADPTETGIWIEINR